MEQSPIRLLAKYSISKGSVVASYLLFIILVITMIITPSKSFIGLSLQIIAIASCILYVGLTIWWERKKPHHIILDTKQIIAGDTAFRLDSIEKIVIRGSNLGIKLKQKRIVPPQLCITLLDEKNGLQTLKKWAEHQQIKVVYGSFLRWY